MFPKYFSRINALLIVKGSTENADKLKTTTEKYRYLISLLLNKTDENNRSHMYILEAVLLANFRKELRITD